MRILPIMHTSPTKLNYRRFIYAVTTALLLTSFTSSLIAVPAIVSNNFDTVFPLTGGQGGLTVSFEIDYNNEIVVADLGSSDIICEGVGATTGKSIPVSFNFWFNKTGGIRSAQYILGPLDDADNGAYSLKLVENEVAGAFGNNPIPPAELIEFTQNITDPMPAFLGMSLEPPLDGEGKLTGGLGFAVVKLLLDFNQDINLNTVPSVPIEIVGTTGGADGKSILYLSGELLDNEVDKKTLEFTIGPLDTSANGEYSIRLLENAVSSPGDNPITIPAGEIATFTQEITDPLPAIKLTDSFGTELDGIFDATDFGSYSFLNKLAHGFRLKAGAVSTS
jgi:hypothetical protein